ncbi:MAG: glycosyltransferase family 4 protein [Candidatus Bathyarchaeia archaeon]
MNVLFLAPPDRRPYELSYFCSFPPNCVTIAVDRNTYERYLDWFDEFSNFDVVFLPKKRGILSSFFHSTASDTIYDKKQLEKVITDKNIDIIVTVELFSFLSKEASVLCRQFSLSHAVIVWENIKNHPLYHLPPFKLNVDFVLRGVKKIIAVTNKSQISLFALNVPAEKVKVIYPGVLLDNFNYRRLKKDFSLLFVGGLEKHKGFHLLLQAFQKLCSKYDCLTLAVVGDGKLKEKLLRMKIKLGERRITYFGEVPHSKINLIYPRAEIFCFPSLKQKFWGLLPIREEQYGFSLVEAMASRLPIIASKLESIQEIAGPHNLYSLNVKELVNNLDNLLENENLRKEISLLNRRRVENLFDARKQSKVFRKFVMM